MPACANSTAIYSQAQVSCLSTFERWNDYVVDFNCDHICRIKLDKILREDTSIRNDRDT